MKSSLTSIIIAISIIIFLGGGAYLVFKKFSASADVATVKSPDLNGDGKVNALDLNIELKAIGSKSQDKRFDLNSDGKLDDLDTQFLMKAWTK